MPTLRMRNFQILQVEAGKQNAGSYYVRADVYDPKNGTAEYAPVTRFGKNIVNVIRAAFPAQGTYIAEDGTQQPWNGTNTTIEANASRDQMEAAIPMTFKRVLNARYVDVDLNGEYCRKYGRVTKDRNGNEHQADEFICEADGTLKVYNSQRVLTSMEYNWINARDQNGRLIPNPKYQADPDNEEPFEQTIEVDENGIPVMHEAAGWESRPAAESIKSAFMESVESAIQKVTAAGHPEQVPYRYRSQNPVHTAEAVSGGAEQPNPNPNTAGNGGPAGTVAF